MVPGPVTCMSTAEIAQVLGTDALSLYGLFVAALLNIPLHARAHFMLPCHTHHCFRPTCLLYACGDYSKVS